MKVFISQPMNGLNEEEIKFNRQEYTVMAKKLCGHDAEIIDSVFEEEPDAKNKPLFYLGRSLQLLATADAAFFGDGWESTRGCIIEHECCERYGVQIVYD